MKSNNHIITIKNLPRGVALRYYLIRLGIHNDAHFFNLTGEQMSRSAIQNNDFQVTNLNLKYLGEQI